VFNALPARCSAVAFQSLYLQDSEDMNDQWPIASSSA